MAAFDRQIETAKKLITKNGEIATIRRSIPGVPDPATPWKPVPPTITNVSVSAVFLNYNLQSSGELYIAGSLIKTGDLKVLIAAYDLPDMTVSDQLVRADGTLYKVVNAYLLDPNGQRILWTMQVRQ